MAAQVAGELADPAGQRLGAAVGEELGCLAGDFVVAVEDEVFELPEDVGDLLDVAAVEGDPLGRPPALLVTGGQVCSRWMSRAMSARRSLRS